MSESHWWERPGLRYEGGALHFGGVEVESLARAWGTPLYLYDGDRVRERFRALSEALEDALPDAQILYAMKANPFPEILELLQRDGAGIDACSLEELELALDVGFARERISFTGLSLSQVEWTGILRAEPGMLNCDGFSQIRAVGALKTDSRIGLRVDPGVEVLQPGKLTMSSPAGGQFGLSASEVEGACEEARSLGLEVVGLHAHLGCGFFEEDLGSLEAAWREVVRMAASVRHLEYVNFGGGLGVHNAERTREILPVDYAAALARALSGSGRAFRVVVEPGDYLVKDAGCFLVSVTFKEEKRSGWYIGVDAGLHANNLAAHYGYPLQVVPCRQAESVKRQRFTVVGQVLEGGDVFASDVFISDLEEGDLLALVPCGGYGASMSSAHTLRKAPTEVLLEGQSVRAARQREWTMGTIHMRTEGVA